MIKAVFFDMNETLLDLSLLQTTFNKYFDDKYVLKYWFTKLLHCSTILGVMDTYKNFREISEVVLEDLFFENQKKLTSEIKFDILGNFKKLPAYDDVIPALKTLKSNNIKIIAISNSSQSMMKEQLTSAKIIDFFNSYYSVDSVQKYKPFQDIYKFVLEKENLKTEEVVMVATHDWDLFGAKKAGLKTGYIKRKDTIFNPYYPEANFKDQRLTNLINKIIG